MFRAIFGISIAHKEIQVKKIPKRFRPKIIQTNSHSSVMLLL